jgi:hypothetical protein
LYGAVVLAWAWLTLLAVWSLRLLSSDGLKAI